MYHLMITDDNIMTFWLFLFGSVYMVYLQHVLNLHIADLRVIKPVSSTSGDDPDADLSHLVTGSIGFRDFDGRQIITMYCVLHLNHLGRGERIDVKTACMCHA